MTRLEDVSKGTMITVKSKEDFYFRVLTREDLERELKEKKVAKAKVKNDIELTKAEKLVAEFSFKKVLGYFGEVYEMHEDWQEAVMQDIEDSGIEVKKIEKAINEVFRNNPTFIEGEKLVFGEGKGRKNA
ncbi:hypothetical protein [Acetobacterium wieringae]|uniref:Uncharacterized protein n=1 Tax=Acetobacterium wieringae TaxID=52694 RepID=A0A1F2PDD8_9FIRM|nr:hypothetical protein [Acetobacterium wieringae]OFV69278.1 hypothetical protein ACWI_33220 [Acetobacterium wieringae]